MEKLRDLRPPIIWVDAETGEVIRGGEDSPEADALRSELREKRIKMRREEEARLQKEAEEREQKEKEA